MKKVAIITPSPELVIKEHVVGGVDKHSLLLMRTLQRHGYKVVIGTIPSFWSKLPTPICSIIPWTKMIQESVNLVIAQSPFGLNVPPRIPIVYVAHGSFAASSHAHGTGFKQRMWRSFASLFERWSSKRADYVVAVSEAVSRMLLKYYKRAADEVILNAVDTDFWSYPCKSQHNKSKPICLFVGLPTKAKGFDVFCQVANSLYKEAEFVAVLGAHAKIPMHNKIHCIMGVDEVAMRNLYHNADLILHPSRFEGCSYTLIEAWASSRITLMAPVGHVPEIASRIPWVREFVITSYDFNVWIKAVRNYLHLSDSAINNIKQKFFYLAKEFHSLPRWEEQWLQILEKFL